MKRDIRVIRMIAATTCATFGSLWIALLICSQVAPPEPEIATLGRHVCLAIFIVSFIWSMFLYAAYLREQAKSNRKDAELPRKSG